MTPREAAEALERSCAAAIEEARRILAAEAVVIRDEVHDTLGTMGGPEGDWQPLHPDTLAEKRRLGQLGRVSAEDIGYATGELRESWRVDASNPDLVTVSSADPVAGYIEHGTSEAPPRPVLAPIAAQHGEDLAHRIGQAVADAITGATGAR